MTRTRVRDLTRLGGRTLGFTLAPAISLVTPLLVIPIVSRTSGGPGILAVAVGQSVGSVAGIVVALGWPLIGSPEVARADEPRRRHLYALGLHTRLVALLACLPVVVIAAATLVDDHRLTSVLTALAFTGYGLTTVWYYIGVGTPRPYIVLEAVPRMIAAALAAAALALGAPLELYPVLLLAAVIGSYWLNARNVLGTVPRLDVRAAIAGIRDQLGPSGARLVNAFHNGGATSIVAGVAPAAALVFASADRTQKSAFNALSAFPEALISWVVGGEAGRRRRVRFALTVDVVFAAVCALVYGLALPWVVVFLFSDVVTFADSTRVLSAVAVFALVGGRAFLAHGPLAIGADRYASIAMAGASVAGVVSVIAGATTFGVNGAISGVIIGELVCMTACLVKVVKWSSTATSREVR